MFATSGRQNEVDYGMKQQLDATELELHTIADCKPVLPLGIAWHSFKEHAVRISCTKDMIERIG